MVEATKVIGDLTQSNKELQRKLGESDATISALEARLVQATSIIEQLASKAKKNQQNKELSEQTLSEMEKLRQDSKTRDERLVEAAKVIDELSTSNKLLVESAQNMQSQQDTMQHRLVEATMVISELRAAISELEEKQAASQKNSSETMEKRLVEATVLISQLREENDNSARREADLNRTIEGNVRQINALEGRVAEATGIIENLFAANRKLEDASRESDSLEGRLVDAAKTISQLRDQNKEAAGETEEIRTRCNKLAVTLRDLTGRYNTSMAELKAASGKEAQLTELVEVMRKELAKQVQLYEELEREKNPTPARSAIKEDLQMAEQMQQLARMIKSEPTTPVRGVIKDGSEQSRALASLVEAVSPMDDKDLLRRLAALDVREARVEARETLLTTLANVRESLKKSEAATAMAERKHREAAMQLEAVQQQLASKEREKIALITRCRELEANMNNLEDETEVSSNSLNRQLGQLQTERAELRRILDSKLQPDAGALAAAEIKVALSAEALKQSDESHAQQTKYLKEEVASQRRLRETYEEVNAALKASGERVQTQVNQLRLALANEASRVEALKKERDAAREEAEKVRKLPVAFFFVFFLKKNR
jgi:chromosome segregation ATPase